MKSLVCVTQNVCTVLLGLRAQAAHVVFEMADRPPDDPVRGRVEEIRSGPGGMLFQGAAVRGNGFKDRSLSFVQQGRTSDGVLLTLAEEGVSVSIPEASFKSALGGFLVRDVASNSSFYGVDGWRCDPLAIQVKADYFPRPDHIEVRGQVIDFRNQDRAVTVVFALPINAEGWMWGDDARRSRVIDAQTDYANLATVPCGATGSMSLYPLAAISGPYVGLAIAIDQRSAAVYRVGYHAQAKLLYIAYDFALVPDTRNFPRSAEFRFHLFRFEPAWGFREALRKYMHFSWMYKSTIPDQGIWMPFTDISTVEGWQDFGFKFKEGDNNVPWDDRHGIFTFRYTEPMTWWMPLEKGVPRTPESAVRVRDSMATGEGFAGQMARIAKVCAMHDEHGQPALLFRDTPWCDGAVWSINPNPHLFGGTNGGTIHWNKQVRQDYYPHHSGEDLMAPSSIPWKATSRRNLTTAASISGIQAFRSRLTGGTTAQPCSKVWPPTSLSGGSAEISRGVAYSCSQPGSPMALGSCAPGWMCWARKPIGFAMPNTRQPLIARCSTGVVSQAKSPIVC